MQNTLCGAWPLRGESTRFYLVLSSCCKPFCSNILLFLNEDECFAVLMALFANFVELWSLPLLLALLFAACLYYQE